MRSKLYFYREPTIFYAMRKLHLYLNGKKHTSIPPGTDPVVLDLPPGVYNIQIRIDFYRSNELTVNVMENEEYYYHINVKQRIKEVFKFNYIKLYQVSKEEFQKVREKNSLKILPKDHPFTFILITVDIVVGTGILAISLLFNDGYFQKSYIRDLLFLSGLMLALSPFIFYLSGISDIRSLSTLRSKWMATVIILIFLVILGSQYKFIMFYLCLFAALYLIIYFLGAKIIKKSHSSKTHKN